MFSSKITTTCLIAAEAVVGVAAGGVGGPGIAVRAELQPLITIVADMTNARALRTIARKPRSENSCVPSFCSSMFRPRSMEFEYMVNFASIFDALNCLCAAEDVFFLLQVCGEGGTVLAERSAGEERYGLD